MRQIFLLMKFKNLSNKETRFDIVPSRYPVRSRSQCKSFGQFNLGKQVQKIYGVHAVLLEEFPIPDERLYIDFYMPNNSIAFEFHGEQHDTFNKFFHGNKDGFKKSKSRDVRKKQWCELNNIILIEVRKSTISAEELKELIQEKRNG